jgi:hypothetical protein
MVMSLIDFTEVSLAGEVSVYPSRAFLAPPGDKKIGPYGDGTQKGGAPGACLFYAT